MWGLSCVLWDVQVRPWRLPTRCLLDLCPHKVNHENQKCLQPSPAAPGDGGGELVHMRTTATEGNWAVWSDKSPGVKVSKLPLRVLGSEELVSKISPQSVVTSRDENEPLFPRDTASIDGEVGKVATTRNTKCPCHRGWRQGMSLHKWMTPSSSSQTL